jgi:hypothetical protein
MGFVMDPVDYTCCHGCVCCPAISRGPKPKRLLTAVGLAVPPQHTQHPCTPQDWVKAIDITEGPASTPQGGPSLLLATAGQDKYVRLWKLTADSGEQADPLTRCAYLDVLDDVRFCCCFVLCMCGELYICMLCVLK